VERDPGAALPGLRSSRCGCARPACTR
jgi:hypothetical protein